jgi:DNA-binding transcriptional ArsR family regulator
MSATRAGGLDPKLLEKAIQQTARMLKCLGHPVRLQILDFLQQAGESTVTEVYEGLGIEQAVASQHLTLMWDKGILHRRREGVHVYYRVDSERATKVLECIRGAAE